MLKIFFSANAFSLLAFFPDVPIGEKPHNRCQLCKIVKCFEFLFLLLILKHSLRIRPEISMALSQQRFSPLTDLLYFIILHKWIITHYKMSVVIFYVPVDGLTENSFIISSESRIPSKGKCFLTW